MFYRMASISIYRDTDCAMNKQYILRIYTTPGYPAAVGCPNVFVTGSE